MRTGRYCFVIPRYFEGIAGGAETLISALARKLALRGDEVLLLATCAKDNRTWENFFEPGEALIDGLKVIRFAVDKRNLDRWIPLQIRLSEGMRLDLPEELDWLAESVNSSSMYAYLEQYAPSFDAVFFGPYLFGTTFWGSLIHPENSVLIPCLHDESPAYTQVMAAMFRQVRGCLFNARGERDLAHTLYGDIEGGDVGMGFEPYGEELLTPYFKDQFPYLVYLGRKETMKNVPLLIDYFIESKERLASLAKLKLVVMGGGSFSDLFRPKALLRDDIIDLSDVAELDKRRVLTHSTALCQPSTNESFSIVLMESWLLKRPVLVHARCAVTRNHVIDSGGGLYFGERAEFSACVEELVGNAALGAEMGRAGERYVREQYSWDAVLSRFDAVVGRLRADNSVAAGAA